MRIATVVVVSLLAWSCSTGAGGDADDAGGGHADVALDGSPVVMPDASPDGSPDVRPDAAPDATPDGGPDGAGDVVLDTGGPDATLPERRVRVLDLGGAPVAGAPVLRHDGDGQLQEQVETDADGWAKVAWRAGDVLSAPVPFDAAIVSNWVSVVGFDDQEELVIGKAGWHRAEVGRSTIRVENIEADERVAVHTSCDATTLTRGRPEAEFRWYDSCVAGDDAMVIATTSVLGASDVLLRDAVAFVTVGEDLTLDTWETPERVRFTLPAELDDVVEVALEVKDRGVGVRRFLANPGQTTLQAALVGRWQLQLWAVRGGSEVFVVKDLAPSTSFAVRADELLPALPAGLQREDGRLRLSFPPSEAVAVRSTVLVMGDPCGTVGYYHNVITEGGRTDVVAPALSDAAVELAPTARSELVVGLAGMDPALAVLTLGASTRYPSPGLSLLQAAADGPREAPLSATFTIEGALTCE